MRPLPPPEARPHLPRLLAPPNLKALPGLRWGGWASNSQGDLTYDDARSEWGGQGPAAPEGTQNPWSGTGRGHGGPRPLLRLPRPHPNPASAAPQPPAAAAGPSSPTSSPPQGPSVPWRPAGGAEPPSHTQGPPILLWQYSLARGPRFPNLCSLPPSCPYCEEVAHPPLLPLPWPGLGAAKVSEQPQ